MMWEQGWLRMLSWCLALLACMACGEDAANDTANQEGSPTVNAMSAGGVCSGNDVLPQSSGDLTVQRLPTDSILTRYFDRFATFACVYVLAAPDVPEDKLVHAVTILAEYLDNDEDGDIDDRRVTDAMVSDNAAVVMFASDEALNASGVLNTSLVLLITGVSLNADETAPVEGFDGSLEKILHLIQGTGYARAYRPEMALARDSLLASATDQARGGFFESVPEVYPDGAWFTSRDTGCDYACQVVQYFYWALTSHLGAHQDRCDDIAAEWTLCTPDALSMGDALATALLMNPAFVFPTTLPDGSYLPP